MMLDPCNLSKLRPGEGLTCASMTFSEPFRRSAMLALPSQELAVRRGQHRFAYCSAAAFRERGAGSWRGLERWSRQLDPARSCDVGASSRRGMNKERHNEGK